MTLTALTLVVVAAFTHASWNLLAKRAADSRHFVWLYSMGSVVVWSPVVAVLAVVTRPQLGWRELGALIVTALLHAGYSEMLMRGYRNGALSIVYPVARGTGPLISFFGAMLVLDERPTVIAAAGALAVVIGVFLIAGGPRLFSAHVDRRALFYGLGTGVFIAAYTVWDGWSVKVLLISPVLLDFCGNLFRGLLLTPRAWADRSAVLPEYRRYWREALGVSVLGPLGYVLVLYAMRLAPVSHVAPARELSMMLGAYFGARFLKEGQLRQRMGAAALIVAGVVGLAIG
jgi:drug/metabolite transporter (DMT)-like permease